MIEVLNEALDAAKNANQEGIVNFLGGRVEAHAKHRWMLRATAKRMGE
jgi:DNA-binding ferritin-like protein